MASDPPVFVLDDLIIHHYFLDPPGCRRECAALLEHNRCMDSKFKCIKKDLRISRESLLVDEVRRSSHSIYKEVLRHYNLIHYRFIDMERNDLKTAEYIHQLVVGTQKCI